MSLQQIVKEILASADIRISGDNPWDIGIYNNDFFSRALAEGELGIGESYMEGWWEAEKIDETINRILNAHLD